MLRSRYAEDELLRAVDSGIAQFINLGAGYDTFPFRRPNWARSQKIVEIDHPATQFAKLKALDRAQIQIPENMAFLPLDLANEELASTIIAAVSDPSLPMFVACLGVLAYLQPETAHSLFASVAKTPKGSRFVFAFASNQAESPQRAPSVAAKTAALGEPWLTRFEVGDLESELSAVGFRVVWFLDPAEAFIGGDSASQQNRP